MEANNTTRWQFSLRALFCFVLACAVLIGIGRTLGITLFLGTLFVLLSAIPVVALPLPQKRAYLVSYVAVYGPFVVMAIYTFFFVSCSHCKKATWTVLPYAPGIIPLELAHRWFDVPRFWGVIGFEVPFFVSVAMVSALAWLVRRTRGRWWRTLSVSGVLLLCAYFASVVLALIRA